MNLDNALRPPNAKYVQAEPSQAQSSLRSADAAQTVQDTANGAVRGDAAAVAVRAAQYNKTSQFTFRLENILTLEKQPSMANPSSYASS